MPWKVTCRGVGDGIAIRRMRRKLRDPVGRAVYQRRQAIVEPVIGVLKEQRGMRQFRRRGLEKVTVEFAQAATAFNLTRANPLEFTETYAQSYT